MISKVIRKYNTPMSTVMESRTVSANTVIELWLILSMHVFPDTLALCWIKKSKYQMPSLSMHLRLSLCQNGFVRQTTLPIETEINGKAASLNSGAYLQWINLLGVCHDVHVAKRWRSGGTNSYICGPDTAFESIWLEIAWLARKLIFKIELKLEDRAQAIKLDSIESILVKDRSNRSKYSNIADMWHVMYNFYF